MNQIEIAGVIIVMQLMIALVMYTLLKNKDKQHKEAKTMLEKVRLGSNEIYSLPSAKLLIKREAATGQEIEVSEFTCASVVSLQEALAGIEALKEMSKDANRKTR